uniref:Uncharacterized protein n=1 Tax=Monopterus albus TaxID=43700 RepID=A0A3Q3IBD3_MONAL
MHFWAEIFKSRLELNKALVLWPSQLLTQSSTKYESLLQATPSKVVCNNDVSDGIKHYLDVSCVCGTGDSRPPYWASGSYSQTEPEYMQ